MIFHMPLFELVSFLLFAMLMIPFTIDFCLQ